MPRPTLPTSPAHAKTAHTPKPPTRSMRTPSEHQSGTARHRTPHHPTDAPKPRNANTTANTPNPTTHRANTPTTGAAPLSCAHTVAPTRLGAGATSVRAGGAAPRHEAKQAKPPQGRAHKGERTQGRARKQWGLRRSGAALRPPDGGEPRAKGCSQ